MKNFFEKGMNKLSQLRTFPREALLYRVIPHMFLDLLSQYFRVEIEGLEHLPKTGSAIITPNHSGYSGFDVLVLGHEIFRNTKRIPRVMAHHLWFASETFAIPAQKIGFVEATIKNGEEVLNKNNMLMLFPEGEKGNFKSSRKAYRLQEFKRGFIRLAIATGAPIIPTLIIGAEETHINLKQIKLGKYSDFLRGLIVPLPLNILPLPAKWKIIFLEPITLPYNPDAADDSELVREIARDLKERMQLRLNKELGKREFVYFKKLF